MGEFDYISVLLSILIGMAVTQLLSGIARLVRDGHALAQAWWVFVIVATLLIASFQVWWISFAWRGVQEWTFFSYIAFMIQPVLLYLLSYLVLPGDLHLDGTALAQAFIDKRRPFYAIFALIPPATFLLQWMLNHVPPELDIDADLRLLFMIFAIPGFTSRRAAVQAAVAVAMFGLLVLYICLVFMRMR